MNFQSAISRKWLFVVKKENKEEVTEYLENILTEVVGEGTNIMSIGSIVWHIKREIQALRTYEDILRGFLNPQEERNREIINNNITRHINKTPIPNTKQKSIMIKKDKATIHSKPYLEITEAVRVLDTIKFIEFINSLK